MVMCY